MEEAPVDAAAASVATAAVEELGEFEFTAVPCVLSWAESREGKEKLMQWNLSDTLSFHRFRFTGNVFSRTSRDQFFSSFFGNDEVLAELNLPRGSGSYDTVYEPLRCTVTNLSFFDRLTECGLVGPAGHIRGCYDEIVEGVTASDLVREMLVNPDSENSCTYSEDEQHEALFQLFKVLVVGGALCQSEPEIAPYLEATRALYKDLMSVQKDSKTKKVRISSQAFLVTSVDGLNLFSVPDSPHNACIVIVDAVQKRVSVVRKSFTPFWS